MTAAASAPTKYHKIQVRANESLEGATRIVEYLRDLGFTDSVVESTDRTSAGQRLHTVLVGKYQTYAEAEKECDRLKAVTRRQPYKHGEGFFQDSFVLTRVQP